MEKQIRRIGVLTSGGDAPGMNALIRSVVRSASANDISVLGIRRGYSGLINGDIIEMGARSVDGIIRKGGTMLYTARCKEMMTEEGLQKAQSRGALSWSRSVLLSFSPESAAFALGWSRLPSAFRLSGRISGSHPCAPNLLSSAMNDISGIAQNTFVRTS